MDDNQYADSFQVALTECREELRATQIELEDAYDRVEELEKELELNVDD